MWKEPMFFEVVIGVLLAACVSGLAAEVEVSKLPPAAASKIDFTRDIQPILDRLCTDCHGYERTAAGGPRAARLLLTGDRGPMYSHSYYMLTVAKLFSDGRNRPESNYAPRMLGSSASRLLLLLDGSHYGAKATPAEKQLVRLWIDSGAAYPGTYAALGTGMIGGYAENKPVDTDFEWPATRAAAAVVNRRCASCHGEKERVLPRALADERGVSFWRPDWNDPRRVCRRLGHLPRSADEGTALRLRHHRRSRLPETPRANLRRTSAPRAGEAFRYARFPPAPGLGPRNDPLRRAPQEHRARLHR